MKKMDLEGEIANLLESKLFEPSENKTLDLNRLAEEIRTVTEKYMIPKPTRKLLDTPDGDIPVTVNEWE